MAGRNNLSGSIAVGGTAQTLSAATNIRNGIGIQNLHATADLWIAINVGVAVSDQPCIRIPPGALYETTNDELVSGLISVIGATTGQKFSAWEF